MPSRVAERIKMDEKEAIHTPQPDYQMDDAHLDVNISFSIRIYVPELNVKKVLHFQPEELVWNVKQQCLASLPKVSYFIK